MVIMDTNNILFSFSLNLPRMNFVLFIKLAQLSRKNDDRFVCDVKYGETRDKSYFSVF